MGMDQNLYFNDADDYTDESLSYHFPTSAKIYRSFSRRRRDYKGSHLRKSLQPRKHHARIEISRDLRYRSKRNHSSRDPSYTSNAIEHGNHVGTVHDIKVTRTSKFARKGINKNTSAFPRKRR